MHNQMSGKLATVGLSTLVLLAVIGDVQCCFVLRWCNQFSNQFYCEVKFHSQTY